MNHKPEVKGTDEAIWRRIRLIPFSVTIPEHKRDPELPAKLAIELPGILAWAVRGCELWRDQGLRPPESVKAATKQYRDESDTIGLFIDEKCTIGPRCETSKADLYAAYLDWCEANDESALSKNDFGRRMMERGYREDRRGEKRTRIWLDIKLNERLC